MFLVITTTAVHLALLIWTRLFEGAGNNNITGSGVVNYASKFTSANVIGTAADGALLGTSGTSSATRTLTLLENGDAQLNFGSYPGAWSSALQIQNNDNTDFVWLSPLADGNNARLRTGGSGLDIYVGGGNDTGTHSTTFDSNGSVGIGITGPAYKLDVNGDVNLNGNADLRVSGVGVIYGSSTDVYGNIRVLQNVSTATQDGMYVNYNSTGGTAADLRFYANGTSERMRILASNGNVGIGTASPSGKLHVNNPDDSFMYLTSSGNLMVNNPESFVGEVRLGAAWNKPGIYVNPDLYLGSGSRIVINDNNQENWYFDGDNFYSNGWGRIYATSSNLHIDAGPGSGLYLNWYAGSSLYVGRGNSTARALFDGNGLYLYDGWLRPHGDAGLYFQDGGTGLTRVQADVGYGSSGQYGSVSTYGSVGGWEGYSLMGRYVWMANGNDVGLYNDVDNYWYMLINRNLTNNGYIFYNSYDGHVNMRIQHTNGHNYASYDGDNNWDFYSDRRLKEHIEKEGNILERLLKLDVVNYDFIEHELTEAQKEKGIVFEKRKDKEIGFIAQDVEQYFPSLVSETEDERYDFKVKALGYSSFGILAVGGIKELKIEKDQDIAGLNKMIAEQNQKIERLERLVEQLLQGDKK
jgi:hypothetical protein